VRIVRNLLALIGLLVLVALGGAILAFEPYVNKARGLDNAALDVYANVARTILTTGDAMQALVYQRRVASDRDVGDVERALEAAAADLGLQSLGTLTVQSEILQRTGKSFPLLQVYLFCDPDLAHDLIRHNAGMAAYLPCRVTLYEDARGGLWLMTPEMDLLLHGSRPLPLALRERAIGLQASLRELVDRAAGETDPQRTEARNEQTVVGFTL